MLRDDGFCNLSEKLEKAAQICNNNENVTASIIFVDLLKTVVGSNVSLHLHRKKKERKKIHSVKRNGKGSASRKF